MKGFFLALFGLVMVAVAAAPAIGQDHGEGGAGTRVTRPANLDGRDLLSVRRAAHQFGVCVARSRTQAAMRAVKMSVDDPGLRNALVAIATDDCLKWGSGGLAFPPQVLRSAVFEGLYIVKYGERSPRDFSGVAALNLASIYQKPLSDKAMSALALAEIGQCAARRNQEAAAQLIKSVPGSDEEVLSIAALQPVLPSCLLNGLQLRLSVDMLRGGIAEALYRLSEIAASMAGARP